MQHLIPHLIPHHRLSEIDVDLIVSILSTIGLKLRNEDPSAMKDFVLSVHTRAAELGQSGSLTQRARLMLELVVDVKNNKGSNKASGAATALSPGLNKWLKVSQW